MTFNLRHHLASNKTISKIHYFIDAQLNIIKLYLMIFKKLAIKIMQTLLPSEYVGVNIGSGSFVKRNWYTLDYLGFDQDYCHIDYLVDYNFNLITLSSLPFDDNSINFFYTSHTLEHIPPQFCPHLFIQFYRSLKPGGAIRIVVPDFKLYYQAYLNKQDCLFRVYPENNLDDQFLHTFARYFVGKISPSKLRRHIKKTNMQNFADYYVGRIPVESQRKSPANHTNWWTFSKLKGMLSEAGFSNIYRSQANKSKFHQMRGEWI